MGIIDNICDWTEDHLGEITKTKMVIGAIIITLIVAIPAFLLERGCNWRMAYEKRVEQKVKEMVKEDALKDEYK